MQFKFALAFVVACIAMTVSAAPVAEVVEVAREPVEEPRVACTLYTCIWYVRAHRFVSLCLQVLHRSLSTLMELPTTATSNVFPLDPTKTLSTSARVVTLRHKSIIGSAPP
ncbi:hypothetical protein K438DRAFT_1965622 [Mycena galopus ATCC 62051]|nr:hypothetical protein K438DRAFT_1965622 [Mycena galopus ATCC 62051]